MTPHKHRAWRHQGGRHPHFGSRRVRSQSSKATALPPMKWAASRFVAGQSNGCSAQWDVDAVEGTWCWSTGSGFWRSTGDFEATMGGLRPPKCSEPRSIGWRSLLPQRKWTGNRTLRLSRCDF